MQIAHSANSTIPVFWCTFSYTEYRIFFSSTRLSPRRISIESFSRNLYGSGSGSERRSTLARGLCIESATKNVFTLHQFGSLLACVWSSRPAANSFVLSKMRARLSRSDRIGYQQQQQWWILVTDETFRLPQLLLLMHKRGRGMSRRWIAYVVIFLCVSYSFTCYYVQYFIRMACHIPSITCS